MKSDTPRTAEYTPDPFDASPTTASCAGLTRSPRPDTGQAQTRPLFKIHCCVGVAVIQYTTATAPPLPIRKRQVVVLPAAVRTQLRRRKPTVRLHVLGAVPEALILQLGQEARHPRIGDGSSQAPVADHPCHVQGFHHHAARRLGYRRRCLVMIVVPYVDPVSGNSATPGVQPFPAVGMNALAVDVSAPGNRLVQTPQLFQSRRQRSGVLHCGSIGAGRHRTYVHIYAYGRPVLHRRRLLTILDAEAGEPRLRRSVDSHLPYRTLEPQFLNHGHPADPGQDNDLTVHPHRVRSVIGGETLLVLAPLETREPHPTAGSLTCLHFATVLTPAFSGLPQVNDRVLGRVLPLPTARSCPSPGPSVA